MCIRDRSRCADFSGKDGCTNVINELYQLSVAREDVYKRQDLTPGHMQIVEIAKAVSKEVRILILDEPTAPLSVAEVEILFRIVRKLRDEGVAIIFISHRLDEVFELTDRVSILRDGEYVTTLDTKETNRAELIKYMVGREMTATFPPRNATIGDVALELKNLTGNGVKNISFQARRGEILGISGLVGAGRTEIMKVVFGAEKKQWGEIYVNGQKAEINSPKDAMHKYGICLIPEDRKREGCFLGETISWNLVYNVVEKISHAGVVDRKKEAEIADYYGKAMRIKAPDLKTTKVMTLSGGNQQKAVSYTHLDVYKRQACRRSHSPRPGSCRCPRHWRPA